ncbi:AraC family transcriptional regulator [Antrihabitans sp. YC3-6]|uniref:AraC family transcriptional regulator n=1 Tax=Antrihabitans stalagmiti TaxID=2799499 RepID=A0A934NUI8_9NOCA|nr:AraC family transcriptional regulator [Antrihabitans stalagmiti]MBJ8341848.1 AraC family transcriptional regulator [Antrihabitans stalagmiti]
MTKASPLERFQVLQSDDLDEFRTSVSHLLTPHRLTPLGRAESIRTKVCHADLGAVSLVYGQHRGAELGAQLVEQLDYYDVNLSIGGFNEITCRGEQVIVDPTTACIISPRMRADMKLSEAYRQLHVRIERIALDRQLEQLTGRPVTEPIRFDARMDLTAPASASWLRSVRALTRDLDQPGGLADSPLGAEPWINLMMSGLLIAAHNNYSHLLDSAQTLPRRPPPVKRAIELIERHPDAQLGVEQLAEVAGVSARSLQRHFRETVGLSPHEYVQRVRLARVHTELQLSRPGSGATVTDVALRWGFTHVPRFAGLYQERYGVAPSETLRSEPPS